MTKPDYSNIANCRTEIPAILRGIFRNFSIHFIYLYIDSTTCYGTPDSVGRNPRLPQNIMGSLVKKTWPLKYTLLYAVLWFLDCLILKIKTSRQFEASEGTSGSPRRHRILISFLYNTNKYFNSSKLLSMFCKIFVAVRFLSKQTSKYILTANCFWHRISSTRSSLSPLRSAATLLGTAPYRPAPVLTAVNCHSLTLVHVHAGCRFRRIQVV